MANSAMDRRYAMLRQQIGEQETQERQQQIESMRRRFAAMGALGSGAAVKAEQQAQEAGAKRLQSAFGQLDIARLGEEQQMEEAEKQRGFMTSERLAGQEFQTGMLGKQQQYATSEREAAQKYATGERESAQTYGTSERQAAQQWQQGQLEKQFAQQLDMLTKQLKSQETQASALRKLQTEMFAKEFDLNKEIAYYNMGKNIAVGTKDDLFGGIMGPWSQPSSGSPGLSGNITYGFTPISYG